MLWIGVENQVANGLLTLDIRLGNRRHVSLGGDCKITREITAAYVGRFIRRCQRDLEIIRSILCIKAFHLSARS